MKRNVQNKKYTSDWARIGLIRFKSFHSHRQSFQRTTDVLQQRTTTNASIQRILLELCTGHQENYAEHVSTSSRYWFILPVCKDRFLSYKTLWYTYFTPISNNNKNFQLFYTWYTLMHFDTPTFRSKLYSAIRFL